MAIGTDAVIHFFGTEDELTDSVTTGTVADAAFSDSNDTEEWTNDDDAPYALLKLFVDDWSAAPDANSTVDVYIRMIEIESTNDEPQPDANYRGHYAGSFIVDAVDADQYLVMGPFELPNYKTSQKYQFYLHNRTGATMGALNNEWKLWVTPLTFGPHA